ncbi:MAG: hypothetical protein PW789_01185 [Edaphobacter sp.]|uniref:hypothetical protein n=1 Tax=Edaphobacter sp. TaxID=1934404 RepID=UPI00238CC919|nr:hypothetical protein [Edaphobacter sp.]MDE1175204.1 hypothetical protein [Edaphobacter sp.]
MKKSAFLPSITLICALTVTALLRGQVTAGGGGDIRPNQYFQESAMLPGAASRLRYTKPGWELTPKQRAQCCLAPRDQTTALHPDHLPGLRT